VAGWFKAFGEQGFTLLFRERAGKRHIGGIKKMTSYRNQVTINQEEEKAAKEKKYIPSLAAVAAIAAKIKKSFCARN
jgi:hypothetical protein